MPHLGGVLVDDNVEIGPNTCIAQGALKPTLNKNNVKIDGLCLIGH